METIVLRDAIVLRMDMGQCKSGIAENERIFKLMRTLAVAVEHVRLRGVGGLLLHLVVGAVSHLEISPGIVPNSDRNTDAQGGRSGL